MKLFDLLAGNLVEQVGKAVDEIFTSDEERLEKEVELKKAKIFYEIEKEKLLLEEERETTKRWLSDNEHFITRLIRPLSLTYMFIFFTAIVLFDGNIGDFHIRESYIPIIETLLVTMVIAYFGSRGVEKVANIRRVKKT